MKFKVLSWNGLKAQREAQIVEADSERDAREAVESVSNHVMGIMSLSVVDRITKADAERAQAKSARSYISTYRLERRAERRRIKASYPNAERIRVFRDGSFEVITPV